ncbi:MAG: ADP-ribosylglycohydrolase family protein [Sphingomonadales bacterium]
MLIEIAIADAYGAGFEYAEPTPDRPNDGTRYVQHPRHHRTKPGMFTDDTQTSCAIAECLLAGTTQRVDFAAAIVRAFKRDPRGGYAGGFRRFLDKVVDGPDFLACVRPHSEKSGAAMRAGPIGLLGSVDAVLATAARQARITHDTPGGIGAAQGAALMVFHQVRGLGPIADLPAFLTTHVPGIDWKRPHRARAAYKGEQIARAALAVLLDSRSLQQILLHTVALGGDTDTVAAIAMATASVSAEMQRNLPSTLIGALENGPYGRDYLAGLDQRLSAAFGAPIVSEGPCTEGRSPLDNGRISRSAA